MEEVTMDDTSQPVRVGLEKLLTEIQDLLLVVVDEDKHDTTTDATITPSCDVATQEPEAGAFPRVASVEAIEAWIRVHGSTAGFPEMQMTEPLSGDKLVCAYKSLIRKATLWDKMQSKLQRVLRDLNAWAEAINASTSDHVAGVRNTSEVATQIGQEGKESATQTDSVELGPVVDVEDLASEADTQVEEGEIRSEASTPADRMSPGVANDADAGIFLRGTPALACTVGLPVAMTDEASASATRVAETKQIPHKEANALLAKLKRALKAETVCFNLWDVGSRLQPSTSASLSQAIPVPPLILPLTNDSMSDPLANQQTDRSANIPLLLPFSSTSLAETAVSRPVDPRLARQQAKKATQERQQLDGLITSNFRSAPPSSGQDNAAYSSAEPVLSDSKPRAGQTSRQTYAAAANQQTRHPVTPSAVHEEVYVTNPIESRPRPGILDLVPDYLRARKMPLQPSAAVDLQASTEDVIAAVDSVRESNSPQRLENGDVPTMAAASAAIDDVVDFEVPQEATDFLSDGPVNMVLSDGNTDPMEPTADNEHADLNYLFDETPDPPRLRYPDRIISAVSSAGLKAMFVGRNKAMIPQVPKVATLATSTGIIKLVAKQPKEIDRKLAAEFAREVEEAERSKYLINPVKAAASHDDDDDDHEEQRSQHQNDVEDATPLQSKVASIVTASIDPSLRIPAGPTETSDESLPGQILGVTYENLLDSDSEATSIAKNIESTSHAEDPSARTSKKRSRSIKVGNTPRKRQARDNATSREHYLSPYEARLAKGKLVPVVLIPYKPIDNANRRSSTFASIHHGDVAPYPVQPAFFSQIGQQEHFAKPLADAVISSESQASLSQVESQPLSRDAAQDLAASVSGLQTASQIIQQTSNLESKIIEILDSEDEMLLDKVQAGVDISKSNTLPSEAVAEEALPLVLSTDVLPEAVAIEMKAVTTSHMDAAVDSVGVKGDLLDVNDVVSDSDDAGGNRDVTTIPAEDDGDPPTTAESEVVLGNLPHFGGLSQAVTSAFTPVDSEFDELYDESDIEAEPAILWHVNGTSSHARQQESNKHINVEATAFDDELLDVEGNNTATISKRSGQILGGIYSRFFG